MPQARYTLELRRRLREDGEATILLDSMESPPYRGYLDTDADHRARLIARARQRLYWAAFYERLRVETQTRGNRVLAVVTGPSPGSVAP